MGANLADAKRLFPTHDAFYFCDGACSKNPGPGGWAFVHYDRVNDSVVEGGGASAGATTNNRMELQAMLEVLRHCAKTAAAKSLVLLDSEYVRKGISEWLPGWKRKNWIKSDGQPVLNRDLWEEVDAVYPALQVRVDMRWVPGHAGVGGNERVDEIAVRFSRREPCELFSGASTDYGHELFAGLEANLAPAARAKANKQPSAPVGRKLAAPVYLSVLDGRLERHATWGECEGRVKGKSGAKFKKVSTEAELASVLDTWKNLIRT